MNQTPQAPPPPKVMVRSDWIETPDSSQLARFAYVAETQVLTIQFQTGSTYDYFEVPQSVFDALKSAESKGSYFIKNIKRASFRYQRK